MFNTNLRPNNYKSQKFPSITKPKIIGVFSIDKQRKFLNDASNLQYLRLPYPPFTFDLNEGFEIAEPKPDIDEQIIKLLNFIISNLNRLKDNSSLRTLQYDFICFRGLLRLIMCTPYENRETWSILATKYKGTIYLCAEETQEKKNEKNRETEQSKRFCYYGFKYEQCVLTRNPSVPPNTSKPIFLAEEFCNMYETVIENNRILFGAEMDGIVSNERIDENTVNWNNLEFIELKVKRRETHFRQKNNFHRFKLIKWWCQSFLVGITRVFIGLRDDRGIVNEIEEMPVREMPKLAQDYWSPAICMTFLVDFLKTVSQDMIKIDNPNIVYKYDWNPETQDLVKRSEFVNVQKYTILPIWYIQKMNSIK